jgi:hypothetical protein
MATTDIKFSSEIFRKDNPMIIAKRRELADIGSVRLAYDADGYEAGRVVARNSTSGLYQKYVDGSASGLGTAAAVMFEAVAAGEFASSGDTLLSRGIFKGFLYKDKLVGLDAAGETDLKARTIVEADGVNVLEF